MEDNTDITKMTVLLGPPGSSKSERALELISRTQSNASMMDICRISGFGVNGKHIQMPPQELRKLMFEDRPRRTIFLLNHFWFSEDREAYLRIIETACACGIQVYKTDRKEDDVTRDAKWLDKYCKFIHIDVPND